MIIIISIVSFYYIILFCSDDKNENSENILNDILGDENDLIFARDDHVKTQEIDPSSSCDKIMGNILRKKVKKIDHNKNIRLDCIVNDTDKLDKCDSYPMFINQNVVQPSQSPPCPPQFFNSSYKPYKKFPTPWPKTFKTGSFPKQIQYSSCIPKGPDCVPILNNNILSRIFNNRSELECALNETLFKTKKRLSERYIDLLDVFIRVLDEDLTAVVSRYKVVKKAAVINLFNLLYNIASTSQTGLLQEMLVGILENTSNMDRSLESVFTNAMAVLQANILTLAAQPAAVIPVTVAFLASIAGQDQIMMMMNSELTVPIANIISTETQNMIDIATSILNSNQNGLLVNVQNAINTYSAQMLADIEKLGAESNAVVIALFKRFAMGIESESKNIFQDYYSEVIRLVSQYFNR